MREIDAMMKEIETIMDSLSRKYGYYQVFEDFLSMTIHGLSFNYKDEAGLQEWRDGYQLEERHQFGKMIIICMNIASKEISETTWYDIFGKIYEMQKLTKEKSFAQFFTPPEICDMMAKMVVTEPGRTITDPAAGSSRTILAANATAPVKFALAVDSDMACVKMSALNLFLHGIDSVAMCQNSLSLNDFRGAFIINGHKTPHIYWEDDLEAINRYIYVKTYSFKEAILSLEEIEIKPTEKTEIKPTEEIEIEPTEKIEIKPTEKTETIKYNTGQQLKLF